MCVCFSYVILSQFKVQHITQAVESVQHCQLKKIAQCESCRLSFIRGEMRTSAWETATEKLLKEIAGEGQYIYGLDEGGVHTIKRFFFFFLAEDL